MKNYWHNKSYKEIISGRKKVFEDPQELYNKAMEYFTYCDENPLIKHDVKGKDALEVEIPLMRVYTLKGFCLFVGVHEDWFRQFKNKLSKEDKKYNQFYPVIKYIEETIKTQKFEGAAAGLLNPLIISRDLGLVDKTENMNFESQPLTQEEIEKISSKLKEEY